MSTGSPADPPDALLIGGTGLGRFADLAERLRREGRGPLRVPDLASALDAVQASPSPFRLVAFAADDPQDDSHLQALLDVLAAPAEPTLALLTQERQAVGGAARTRGLQVRGIEDALADPGPLHSPTPLPPDLLASALDGPDLVARFQPKVDLADGRVTGFEALMRWCHPEQGFVATERLIEAIEAAGLSDRLAERFGPLALAPFVGAAPPGLETCTLALNVPLEVLLRSDLPDRLGRIAASSRVARERVIVELTEGQFAHDLDALRRAAEALRGAGFGLALDDLGQEQDGRAALIGGLFTQVKLDRSLIAPELGAERLALRRRLVEQARAAGIVVVAEGVESEAALDRAVAAGADEVQGWWVGRPMAGRNLAGWAEAWRASATRRLLAARTR